MAAQQNIRFRPQHVVVRSLHAAFVLTFVGVWLTAEWGALRSWHEAFGYALVAVLVVRVMWSLVQPQASLERWWRTLRASVRRLQRVHSGGLRPATWSVAGMAGLVCAILALVPACFVSGWVLGRLFDALSGPVGLHRWLGHALMLVVASHVALAGVLVVLRGAEPESARP